MEEIVQKKNDKRDKEGKIFETIRSVHSDHSSDWSGRRNHVISIDISADFSKWLIRRSRLFAFFLRRSPRKKSSPSISSRRHSLAHGAASALKVARAFNISVKIFPKNCRFLTSQDKPDREEWSEEVWASETEWEESKKKERSDKKRKIKGDRKPKGEFYQIFGNRFPVFIETKIWETFFYFHPWWEATIFRTSNFVQCTYATTSLFLLCKKNSKVLRYFFYKKILIKEFSKKK